MMNMEVSQKASLKDWVAIVGASLGAFMAILDITMNNGSLRNIQGTLGAGPDEASWIMTSYLAAEVIAIPMSAWLSEVFSPRKYILFNIFLFVIFSMACGFARTLPFMIFARFFQGLTGGVLIPLAASTVMTKLHASQRDIGLSLFTLTVSLAPALGPTLGGWITANYGWPYSFYINIIPGALALLLVYFSFEHKPMKLNLLRFGDWYGILALTIGLGTLTYILEEGNRKDWLGDKIIFKTTMVCFVSLALFLWIELKTRTPFIDIRLFLNRNFFLSTIAASLTNAFVLAYLYAIPNFLLQIQGYDAFQIGKVLLWGGGPIQIPIMLAIPILVKLFGGSTIAIIGGIFLIASSYLNSTITHLTAGDQFIFPQILRSIGGGLIVTPLTGMAFGSVDFKSIGSAVGLYNLMRTLSGSMAIAGFGTFLSHRFLFHFSRISERIVVSSGTIYERIEIKKAAQISGVDSDGILDLGRILSREAYVMAYADTFLALGALMVGAIILVLLMKKSNQSSSVKVMDH